MVLGDKIILELAVLTSKTYSHITDGSDGNKKAKNAKKCGINKNLNIEATQLASKINKLQKNKLHVDFYEENVKKSQKIQ